MMEHALDRQRTLAGGAPHATEDDPHTALAPFQRDPRHPALYPSDGLVLKQTLRDLPRTEGHPSPQNRPEAINFDYAWFRAHEAREFLPERLEVGARRDLPRTIVRRLARFHLLDSVRGETPPWREAYVKEAQLSTAVVAIEGANVHLQLDGTVLNAQGGTWAIRAFQEQREGMTRGYHCRLRGELTFDTVEGAFTRFDLLAIGDRWGGTEHNGRFDDLPPAPMGIAFQIAGSTPADRTPPHANLWEYFDVPPAQRPK